MKFQVNAAEFARALRPCVEIATKNLLKDYDKGENRITLTVEDNEIQAHSCGGGASVISTINGSIFGQLSYKCFDKGQVTIPAKAIIEALSVFSTEEVNVELSSQQVVISPISDSEIVQPVPLFNEAVPLYKMAEEFETEVAINREVFIEGCKKVKFAIGFEEQRRNYMCLVFETDKNGVRFIAGSGGIFAINSMVGSGVEGNSKTQIIFPHYNINEIITILSLLNVSEINIKYGKASEKVGNGDQIVIEAEGIKLSIYRIDTSIKYPNIDGVLTYHYPNVVYTKASDWERAVAGVSSVSSISTTELHNTEVITDTEKQCFRIETKGNLKAKHKVNIDDQESITTGDKPWFRCNSAYLKHMVDNAVKESYISLHFENQEKVKDVDERVKPILVKYPEKPNDAKKVVENFEMFFAVSHE